MFRVEDQIKCWLLFEEPHPSFDGAFMAAMLNSAFPALSFRTGPEEAGKFMTLKVEPSVFIAIEFNHEPLPMKGFKSALTSPYQQQMSPGIEEQVERHSSGIVISVSTNSPFLHVMNSVAGFEDLFDQVKDMVPPIVEVFEPRHIESKISLCSYIARALTHLLKPTAIHWEQSNLILAPSMVTGDLPGEFPTPLHVHPFFYSESGSGKTVGLHTFGARHVIGHEVHFNECSADFRWMFQNTLMMIKMAKENGYQLIPDGDSFGHDENEIIRVRHLPAEPGAVPIIELTVEKSVSQGIGVALAPQTPPARYVHASAGRPVLGKRKPN